MTLRLLWTAAALLLIAGCSSTAQREATPPDSAVSTAALQSRLARLSGQFGSAIRLDQPEPGVIMRVAPGPGNAETWALEFLQTSENAQRGFLLAFERSLSGPEIAARFIPLQVDGSLSRQSCGMRFRLLSGVLSGETDPRTCRFGEGQSSIGLLKEIALSDRQIIIADQLIPSTGSGDQSTDVLRLYRLDRFTGSIRTRTGPDHAWRVSKPIVLEVAGSFVEPADAADMPLDVRLRLLLVEGQNAGAPLIHLQAIDASTGHLEGQTWANAQVETIGMALETVQINLDRVKQR